MLQTGFLQFDPRFGNVPANLKTVETALAGTRNALIVLPELFSTGYNFSSHEELAGLAEEIPEGPVSERLLAIAAQQNLHLVAGIAERLGHGAEAAFFNSCALFGPRGFLGTYRKVHLFAREKLFFTAGDLGFPVFTLDLPGSPKVGMMICFDWRFPEAARSLALAGADIIAHPSNLLMPWCQEAMITRCLENRVYAVTCNRTGVEDRGGVRLAFTGSSQIVDPDGRRMAEAGPAEEALAIVSIDPAAARIKTVNDHNDLFEDRKPGLYR